MQIDDCVAAKNVTTADVAAQRLHIEFSCTFNCTLPLYGLVRGKAGSVVEL